MLLAFGRCVYYMSKPKLCRICWMLCPTFLGHCENKQSDSSSHTSSVFVTRVQGGTQTNQTRNTNDSNTNTTRESSSHTGAGGTQTSQNKTTTNTVDESMRESSQHYKSGGGVSHVSAFCMGAFLPLRSDVPNLEREKSLLFELRWDVLAKQSIKDTLRR